MDMCACFLAAGLLADGHMIQDYDDIETDLAFIIRPFSMYLGMTGLFFIDEQVLRLLRYIFRPTS